MLVSRSCVKKEISLGGSVSSISQLVIAIIGNVHNGRHIWQNTMPFNNLKCDETLGF